MKISKKTERRFVLGLQGLWPGRRWKGLDGTRSALSMCRRIRVDPLDVVGRSHDLILASRVASYQKYDLDVLLYKERADFEHGGAVSIFPRDLLRLHSSWVQNEGLPKRWETWHAQNKTVVKAVLREIEKRGPLDSQEWAEGERVDNYRSSRAEGVALYYLWRHMDIMIHHREGNRKFYDLTERMFGDLPEPLPRDATLKELAAETLSWLGLSGQESIPYLRTNEEGRGRSIISKKQLRQSLVDDGLFAEVNVEGKKETSVLRRDALPLLEDVEAGNVPQQWKPLYQKEPEAVFLAPLDIVIANGRSKTLFDFEYLWEVYKPENKRRWGYFVLPVLVDDQLVGRIEPVVDPGNNCLRILRIWWEKQAKPSKLVEPFARGIVRMSESLQTSRVELVRVGPPAFRSALERQINLLSRIEKHNNSRKVF
jgi:uncharacterized protein